MKREILRITIFVFVLGVAYTGLSFKSKVDLSSYKVSEGSFCYHVPNENEMVSKEKVVTVYFVMKSWGELYRYCVTLG